MLSVTSKPEEWIKDMTHNRARKAGDIIYKQEFDRHLENGTLPPNATKGNLILAHEFPVVVESLSEPVLDDTLTSDVEADLEEKTYQIISLEARLQALEQKILAAN